MNQIARTKGEMSQGGLESMTEVVAMIIMRQLPHRDFISLITSCKQIYDTYCTIADIGYADLASLVKQNFPFAIAHRARKGQLQVDATPAAQLSLIDCMLADGGSWLGRVICTCNIISFDSTVIERALRIGKGHSLILYKNLSRFGRIRWTPEHVLHVVSMYMSDMSDGSWPGYSLLNILKARADNSVPPIRCQHFEEAMRLGIAIPHVCLGKDITISSTNWCIQFEKVIMEGNWLVAERLIGDTRSSICVKTFLGRVIPYFTSVTSRLPIAAMLMGMPITSVVGSSRDVATGINGVFDKYRILTYMIPIDSVHWICSSPRSMRKIVERCVSAHTNLTALSFSTFLYKRGLRWLEAEDNLEEIPVTDTTQLLMAMRGALALKKYREYERILKCFLKQSNRGYDIRMIIDNATITELELLLGLAVPCGELASKAGFGRMVEYFILDQRLLSKYVWKKGMKDLLRTIARYVDGQVLNTIEIISSNRGAPITRQ